MKNWYEQIKTLLLNDYVSVVMGIMAVILGGYLAFASYQQASKSVLIILMGASALYFVLLALWFYLRDD